MVQTITTAIAAEKTSSTAQSALSENSEAKVRKLCQTFQRCEDFCQQVNPNTQIVYGSDERKTIMGNYATLEQLDLAFGEGAASSWLLIAIADLNVFSGSKKMDDAQMKSLASLIAQRYSHLKYSVLQLFFYKFKSGDFGKFYGKMDPMVVTCALKDFTSYVDTKTSEYLVESWQKLYDEYDQQVAMHRELKNMDIPKKNRITSKNQMKIIVDFSLLKLLSANTKKTGKFTRVQALCDLIERQYLTALQEEGEYLKGSILEFAKNWRWDRETVNRFLNELEQQGIVSSQMTQNRKTFKVNYTTEEEIDSLAPAKLAEP